MSTADTVYDLIVVGGGVTGAACARDAALRGLSVLLLERTDFAAGTSSRSSKMIHGGLRYLETYQFKLVREGVRERELSLKLAPHLTHLTPHLYAVYEADTYGLGMLNFALTFYDAFSGQWRQRRHRLLDKPAVLAIEPRLNPNGLLGAGLYYDALTDDARYTMDLITSATANGAVVRNHTAVTGLLRDHTRVTGVRCVDGLTGTEHTYRARVVVNATGPWTGGLVAQEYGQPAAKLRPSKGVHIVFDRADFPLNHVIFLRSPDDGRVTWPTPALEEDRVYVGTTDTDYTGDPDRVEPTDADITYLLNVANHTMPDAHLTTAHIVGAWAGLRPLVAPAPGTTVGNASREHRVETGPGGMITISGGKLTSNRVMAKHVVDQVMGALKRPAVRYTADLVPLSGGNPAVLAQVRRMHPETVPAGLWDRWVRRYGGNATALLAVWEAHPSNRVMVGPRQLSLAEIKYAVRSEMAVTLEDLMVRRTSLFFWERDGGLRRINAIAGVMSGLLDWSDAEMDRQIEQYAALVRRHRPAVELTGGPLVPYYQRLLVLHPGGNPAGLALAQIVAGPDVLNDHHRWLLPFGRVVIVQDETEMKRAGVSVKPAVRDAIAATGRDTAVVVVPGTDVHTEPRHIEAVRAVLRPGDTVVALGSGVIADITKHAVHEFEAGGDNLYLSVVQTANSVCAFASGMAVLTIDKVKRTVPSRLPDTLVLDSTLLRDAPAPYSTGGVGDASVAAVSFADYRLGFLLNLSGWEPLSWDIMAYSRHRFLGCDPVYGRRDQAHFEAVALDLAACGLAMTVAGESAPLSGLEHVTSHTLDMAAEYHHRPTGNHGSQCALATILSLIAWDKLLALPSLGDLDPERLVDDVEQATVRAAFGPLDDTGAAWGECWHDYAAKLAGWRAHRDDLTAFARDWPAYREDLRCFVTPPADFVAALRAAGHPLRWEDIPTGITPGMARWAFTNARLMRKRTSVADLLALAGVWDEPFIDSVFATYSDLIAAPADPSHNKGEQ